MKQLYYFFTALALVAATSVSAGEIDNFNMGWRFSLNSDVLENVRQDFDDSGWRELNLPHDWAIEGDFDQSNPSGTGGGALPGGIGWYRKTFSLNSKDQGKVFRIEFDGVYMNSSVYINGHLLGTRPYGYISFGYDLTPYLNWNGPNITAVRSIIPTSPTAGGTRLRHLSRCTSCQTCPLHVAQWGTFVTSTVNPEGTAKKR